MSNLETALEKAGEGEDQKLEKEISKELVQVYQTIAQDFEKEGHFDEALKFFEKCLTLTQQVKNREQEAECYQKMAHIQKTFDLNKAIELLNQFLSIVEETNTPEGKQKVLEAHKELGELHAKNGNVHAAINHFE